MSEEAGMPIFHKMSRELIGGKIIDVGILTEARQPYLKMLVISNNNEVFTLTFDQPPKINGEY